MWTVGKMLPFADEDFLNASGKQLRDVLHLPRRKAMQILERRVKRDTAPECLEIQALGSGQSVAHRIENRSRMLLADERRPEFILDASLFQKLDPLAKLRLVRPLPDQCPILGQARLEFHRDIIEQSLAYERAEHCGPVAVGIELDRESQIPHTDDECLQVGHNGRFAAGDHHALEHPLPLLEEIERRLLRNETAAYLGEHLRQDEFRIVTEAATIVAAAGEDDARDFSRKIQQRESLYAAYDHNFKNTNFKAQKPNKARAQNPKSQTEKIFVFLILCFVWSFVNCVLGFSILSTRRADISRRIHGWRRRSPGNACANSARPSCRC